MRGAEMIEMSIIQLIAIAVSFFSLGAAIVNLIWVIVTRK